MNFWDTITGNDMNREFEGFEVRAEALPDEYQAAWAQGQGRSSSRTGTSPAAT